jgi:hypothetical protein
LGASLEKTPKRIDAMKGAELLVEENWSKAAEVELLALWKYGEPHLAVRALQLLSRTKNGQKFIEAALRDNNSDICIAALRIARELKFDLIPHLKFLAKDSSSQVRRECALALRHNFSAEAPGIWAELAARYDGKDRWFLEALGIGADKQRGKFFDAWLKRVDGNWNTESGRNIVWRIHSKKTPDYLAQLISDPTTSETDRNRYFRALDFIKGSEKEAALFDLMRFVYP